MDDLFFLILPHENLPAVLEFGFFLTLCSTAPLVTNLIIIIN